MIPEKGELIKISVPWHERLENFLDSRLFFAVILVLVAVVSFELGLYANTKGHKTPVTIKEAPQAVLGPQAGQTTPIVGESSGGGEVVASKGGTKYYFPWCGSAGRISDKNKINFASIAAARAAGYTPAANCKGLE